jgi:hypothetical protein
MSDVSKKLRILPGVRILTLGAPESLPELLDPLPENASLSTRASGKFDVVLFFVTDTKSLEKGLSKAIAALQDEAVFWIGYPKKSSGIKTDLSRDDGWKPVFEAGFGPVTQVAIDETWSALRFKVESTIERKSGSVVSPMGIKKAPAPAAKKKAIVPPDDFVNALDANEAAGATWQTLAPSHIKEYVTWIEDAKKPETRVRRIEQAVTMLADGVRDRNAKYAGR